MTAEGRAEPGASGLCPGEWRTARVGVEPGEGWETQAGSGRCWLSRLEAGTPRTSTVQSPRGRVVWQPRVEVKRASSQQVDRSPVPTVGSL